MFIARQPIFDRNMNVYGYELLYRKSEQSTSYEATNSDNSTATVLGGLFELGVNQLVGNKKAFVNFDYKFLLSDAIELIEPNTMVIEILENIRIDDSLVNRIRDLKKGGYKFALDDFEEDIHTYPIVSLADIIKFDILLTPLDTIKKEVKTALNLNKYILAEKIETEDAYMLAKEMGFHFFQGYFFSKPKIIAGLRTKRTASTVYQSIITELHSDNPTYQRITEIIETDVSLAYRMMRVKGNGNKGITIKDVLVKMGLTEIERWINVLMLQEISDNKPKELIRLSLVRSKFGELIAYHSNLLKRRHEVSLMCLFSILDALLDLPMEQALEGVSVSDDVKEMLIHRKGSLMPIYEILSCYENGQCNDVEKYVEQLDIDPNSIFSCYLEAIQWADEILNEMQ